MWKGVIIEESLDDITLLDMVTEVGYLESLLEGDGREMHFHQFEIADDKKDQFVTAAKKSIKEGWYIHICRDGKMMIIFKDMAFEFTEDEKEEIQKAKEYGMSVGVLKDQLEIENLIRNPFD